MTAGLIGGRIGNKGGVGISLKVAGVSLLFVNAHLAGKRIGLVPDHSGSDHTLVAHEERAAVRVANMEKIKV